jgi:hypothetical protein
MEMSDRTKSYVKEFIRLGSDFDRTKWLRDVRAAEQRGVSEAGDLAACEKQHVPAPGSIAGQPGTARAPVDQPTHVGRPGKSSSKIATALKRVARAWSESQRSRNRDAIYDYLSRVFSLVKKYRQRSQLGQLIRGVQRFGGLPKNKQADAYTVVIRATTSGEIDHRAVSKYARALRFCRKRKGDQSLQAFIKNKGGINACAARYAQRH